jgi:hypothetical protein
MRQLWRVWFGGVVLLCSLTACGSDESAREGSGGRSAAGTDSGAHAGAAGSDTTEPTGPGADELPELLAPVICQVASDCLGPLAPLMLGPGECAAHWTRGLEDTELGYLPQAIQDGRVEYHPERVQACLDELSGLGCDFFSGWHSEPCEAAITGTVSEGGECSLDFECEGDLFCRVDGSCPGACTRPGGERAACAANEHCEPGLVCAEGVGRCVVPGRLGDECREADGPCALPLLCMDEDEAAGTPGTCTELVSAFSAGEGEQCSIGATWQLCEADLYCVLSGSAAGTCSSERALSGGDCVVTLPDQCPPDEYCDPDGAPPYCRPLPGAGDPCTYERFGPTCAASHVCIEDVCRELRRVGESCTAHEQCYSERCERGVCVQGVACVGE